jgi:hypothetical protein
MKEVIIIRDDLGSYFREMADGESPYIATRYPREAYRFISYQAAMLCVEEIIQWFKKYKPQAEFLMKIEKYYIYA